MAEDLTGLTSPSKNLVKRYKLIYGPDPAPTPIYPAAPAPIRPSSTPKTPFGGSTNTVPPTYTGKTIAVPPNGTYTIGGSTYKAGPNGGYVHMDAGGNVTYVSK